MSRAIELLRKERQGIMDKCEHDLQDIDRAIALLQSEQAEKPKQPLSIKPGQYKDMNPADAMRAYLIEVGAVDGIRVPYSQLLDALRRGGCAQGWTPERYDRVPKLIMHSGKWNDVFDYDKATDSVSLKNRSLNFR